MLYATKTMEQWGPNLEYLINLWFLSEYLMKFNYIFHKYKTELFWFDDIIFVPLIRTEILHFSGISLGGRTLGTPVYIMRPKFTGEVPMREVANLAGRLSLCYATLHWHDSREVSPSFPRGTFL